MKIFKLYLLQVKFLVLIKITKIIYMIQRRFLLYHHVSYSLELSGKQNV